MGGVVGEGNPYELRLGPVDQIPEDPSTVPATLAAQAVLACGTAAAGRDGDTMPAPTDGLAVQARRGVSW